MSTPKQKLEGSRSWPFTIIRRDRCVEKIMKETGCDKWTATIAYRIATAGLQGAHKVVEDGRESV
jgi:hypothetical protein